MNKTQFEAEVKSLGDPPTDTHELAVYTEAKLDLVIRYLKAHKVLGGGR